MNAHKQLTAILAAHESPGFETWTENGEKCTVWTCICGWSTVQAGFDPTAPNRHIADAILARFAVTGREVQP